MTEQLERWRRDTPGTANIIHFNNAGAALMPKPVQKNAGISAGVERHVRWPAPNTEIACCRLRRPASREILHDSDDD